MDIETTGLAGLARLDTPVWLVDVPRATILWCNDAAQPLALAPAESGAAGRPGQDRLAGLLATRFGAAGADAPPPAGINLPLVDGAGRRLAHRARMLPGVAWTAPGMVVVEAVPEPETDAPMLEDWLSASAAILGAMAGGSPVETVLARIVGMIETALPGSVASVVLLDPEGRRIAASIGPGLPEGYGEALLGLEIGPGVGSCGTAMHDGRRIIVEDIEAHPCWEGYRHLVRPAGLRSCWSEPVRAADGRVLGSFAIYGTTPGAPDRRGLRVIEAAGNLASIALEADRSRAEARAATERLRASEARLRSLIDASPSVIFLKDREGRYATVNAAFTRLYGLEPERVIGRTAEEVLGPEMAERYTREEARLGEDRPIVSSRHPQPLVHGMVQDVTKFLVRGADGAVEGIGTIATDVTELHETGRSLALLSERLALAVEAAGVGVIDYHLATGVMTCDARMAEIYGLDPGSAAAMTDPEDWIAMVHPDDAGLVRDRLARARAGDVSLHSSFRIIRPEGTLRHIRSAARVIREEGRPARVVGVNIDVTADVVMAEALAERSREAEAANQAKSRLLANVSHELRTPLNGVLGCAQLLARSGLDDTQRRHLTVIEASGQALLELIQDLLDIGRIESGTIALETAPVDIRALVEGTLDMVRDMAEARGLRLLHRVDPALEGPHMGDARRIRQVLLNLLSNAVKFTATGHVALVVGPREGAGLRFSVRDTGPGIPPAKRDWIFEPFARIESPGNARRPGTGLGLAIVRELVTLMGGEITLGAGPEGGAQFDIDLPLPCAGAGEGNGAAAGTAEPDDAERRRD